ncbi:type V CRISPR-associated protein Cas12k [Nostoc sp. UHCC 0702]|nr:type V CRISPR-associated protein Cas12k [Nostoc sp. UHCC 0702]
MAEHQMNSISTFDITKYFLLDVLKDIKTGRIQLPDFQRDWVWDDTHVRRLLASISLAYPIGAVMMLQQSIQSRQFKPRLVDGVLKPENHAPNLLILDGQQRLTTLRSVKQLLGKNYNLLNRQRQQQQRLSHERHKAQKQNAPNSFGESELGQYVDRLLADAIVAIAKNYSASSIVLPKLRDMREIIQSEVQTRAEQKIKGYKEGQQEYAKQYRNSIHRWSYGRLIDCIQSKAAKVGILIEIGSEPTRGSPQEKARDLAVFAYQERQAALV